MKNKYSISNTELEDQYIAEHDIDPLLLEQHSAARAQAEMEFDAGLLSHKKISEQMLRRAKKEHEKSFPDIPFDKGLMREEMLIQERAKQIFMEFPYSDVGSPATAQNQIAGKQIPHQMNAPVPYGRGSVVAMWIAAVIGFMAFFPLGIVLAIVAVVMGTKLKAG
ncbi:hypothetical protein K3X41_14395 [Aliiroseovarius crassostreae]|uniref:hypothetical protein n=1 Tax=Aliiroseovarius crassostreae TaxID=154981 RepID=UPI0021FB22D8|nr:hypothetical protein [Aliiroseovarius crassostreae]UWQ11030.1 hypothetical protein K3X41_14395 [Aliiroseovarius crassostreae]